MHSLLKKDFIDGKFQLSQPFYFLNHFQNGHPLRDGNYIFLAQQISKNIYDIDQKEF